MKRHQLIFLSLAFATLVCLVLLVMRCVLIGRTSHVGIFFNILLAWIPYGLSLAVARLVNRTPVNKLLVGIVFLLWILFLPNAAYIVTDLTHWRKEKTLPIWYDWIFLSAAAWVGLFLAFHSIQILQRLVTKRRGARAGWWFAGLSLAASSLGVYVGRFLRWNSWDAMLNLKKIFGGLEALTQPQTAFQAFGFCVAYFIFTVMVYVMLYALSAPRWRLARHHALKD